MNIHISHIFPSQKLAMEPMALTTEKGEFTSFEVIELAPSRAQANFENMARSLQKPIPLVVVDNDRLEKLCLSGLMEDYFSELKTIEARRLLTKHRVDIKKDDLAHLRAQYPELAERADSNPEAITALKDALSQATPEQMQYYSDMVDALAAGKDDVLSSRDINQMIFDAIDSMANDYLDVFQQAVEKNAAFFRDFTDFIATLRNFIKADGDSTILSAKDFLAKLENLIGDYKVPGIATTLYPVQGSGKTDSNIAGATEAECIAWAREMGLDPALCVSQIKEGPDRGKYIVHIDVSPLQTIKESVKPIDGDGNMKNNAAQWASWQTMLDLQKDTIQTGMQTLTQKYSNANSTFDNVVKILSNTISALLEADKAFLHF